VSDETATDDETEVTEEDPTAEEGDEEASAEEAPEKPAPIPFPELEHLTKPWVAKDPLPAADTSGEALARDPFLATKKATVVQVEPGAQVQVDPDISQKFMDLKITALLNGPALQAIRVDRVRLALGETFDFEHQQIVPRDPQYEGESGRFQLIGIQGRTLTFLDRQTRGQLTREYRSRRFGSGGTPSPSPPPRPPRTSDPG
jgi:hypothetical protein